MLQTWHREPRVGRLGRRSRIAAVLVVAILAAAQLVPGAGAQSTVITRVADSEDSGAVDLNRDGNAEYVRYGLASRALSVGEQPSDGTDLRLLVPFSVPQEAIDAVRGGGSATVTMLVWRTTNLGGRAIVVDAFPGGAPLAKSDYRVAATRYARLVPSPGRLGVDVTGAVRSMPGAGRLTVRVALAGLAPRDGRQTQVNIATSEATKPENRPVLRVAGPVTPATVATTTTTTAPLTATTATTAPPTTTTAPPTTTTAPVVGDGRPTAPVVGQPPSAVTGGTPWDVVFADEFSDAGFTASQWDTGMRSGAKTLEGNTELQWYAPGNSTVTTDTAGTSTVSVLRQSMRREATAGKYYTVRTLCRLYPPAAYPQYYDSKVDNGCTTSNTNKTLVPYQFTSGMLNSAKSFGFRYGYVEARVKMPKGFALWPAFWMRDWQPWAYEIDVMEGFDRNARLLRSTYWWGSNQRNGTNMDGGDVGESIQDGFCRGWSPSPLSTSTAGRCSVENALDLSTGYHTIGLNWTPTRYEFFLDGVKIWQSPDGANVNRAYNHLILNLAFGNNQWEWNWVAEGARPFETDLSRLGKSTVEWDYVRVWQAPGARDVCTTGSCPG